MKYGLLSFLLFASLFLSFLVFPEITIARQGCCSWHGGVSRCDTSVGRQVCNDGTYSPSCTCAYIPPAPTSVPTPIPTKVPTPKPTQVPTVIPTSIPSPEPTLAATPQVEGTTDENGQTATESTNQVDTKMLGLTLMLMSLGLGYYGVNRLRTLRK